MIIAIEGIDGAGKTTVLNCLKKFNLKIDGIDIKYFDKKELNRSINEPEELRSLKQLRDIIWRDNEANKDPFGALFWIKLISAWYTYLEPISHKEMPNELRIYDGWFYRNIIKTCMREKITQSKVEIFFEDVKHPDLTVLLDVDPQIVWNRNSEKKASELGYWDGELGDPMKCFINYQSRVRIKLLEMGRAQGWKILTPQEEDAKQVAQNVATLIIEYLSNHF